MKSVGYKNLGYPLYHITFDPNLPKVLYPQLPAGGEDPDGVGDDVPKWPYPEPSIPRVSFSDTLVGALRGVYPNWAHLLEESHTITFWVYRADPKPNHPFYSPRALASFRHVHDALITGEHITTSPIAVSRIGQFSATIDPNSKRLEYKVFGIGEVHNHSPLEMTVFPVGDADKSSATGAAKGHTLYVLDNMDTDLMLAVAEIQESGGKDVVVLHDPDNVPKQEPLEWIGTQLTVKTMSTYYIVEALSESKYIVMLRKDSEFSLGICRELGVNIILDV